MSVARPIRALPGGTGRLTILLVAVLAALAVWSASSAVPRAAATAENFCTGAWLQPYTTGGDRCTAPNGAYLVQVIIQTYERAGCESLQNNGVVLDSWVCTGSNSAIYSNYDGTRWAHGIIRNNNLSFAGKFGGGQTYF